MPLSNGTAANAVTLTPIAYECDGLTEIHRCRAATFAWGTAPEYWYISRPLFTMDAPEIGWTLESIREYKARGFSVVYWSETGWAIHTPKQFATPEAAHNEWLTSARAAVTGEANG